MYFKRPFLAGVLMLWPIALLVIFIISTFF